MEFLTKEEFEKQRQARGIQTTPETARAQGLFPKTIRKAHSSGSSGSEGYYTKPMLSWLQIIDVLRSKGVSFSAIRQKLDKIIASDTALEEKKEEVKKLLKQALNAGSDEKSELITKALMEVEEIEVGEMLNFEQRLLEFANEPEARLRYLLGLNLPSKFSDWQR